MISGRSAFASRVFLFPNGPRVNLKPLHFVMNSSEIRYIPSECGSSKKWNRVIYPVGSGKRKRITVLAQDEADSSEFAAPTRGCRTRPPTLRRTHALVELVPAGWIPRSPALPVAETCLARRNAQQGRAEASWTARGAAA